MYLCGQVENTKWILCSRGIGVKCAVFKISDVQNVFALMCTTVSNVLAHDNLCNECKMLISNFVLLC